MDFIIKYQPLLNLIGSYRLVQPIAYMRLRISNAEFRNLDSANHIVPRLNRDSAFRNSGAGIGFVLKCRRFLFRAGSYLCFLRVHKMQTIIRRLRKELSASARDQGFALSTEYTLNPTTITLKMLKRGKTGDLQLLQHLAKKAGDTRMLQLLARRNRDLGRAAL